MKVSVATLFLLTLTLTTPVSYSQSEIPESIDVPTVCCWSFSNRALPRSMVVGYQEAFKCPQPGIIFVTRKNRKICTNPNWRWVQKYILDSNIPLLPSRSLA